MKKAIHYINQFFGGIGGEDKADFKPELKEGVVGPGMALNSLMKEVQITHTIICGDNYMGSNKDEAISEIMNLIKDLDFDFFIAGPAFQAGRYGVACGNICKAIKDKYHIPVVTSMNVENPGVEMFKKEMPVFEGGHSAAATKNDAELMAKYIDKIAKNETLGGAEENGYFPRGVRHQVWLDSKVSAAKRGVDMLVKKLNGEKFETELPIPKKDSVPVATPIKNLKNAKIAILTTGGIVPVDNPDRIQSASATRWGRYDISKMDRLKGGEFKTIHAGFDPAAADNDPNVIVPLDAMRNLLKKGVYGKLHDYFYSTVGTGTTQAEASRMGKEMLEHLKADNVDGVIMVST
ncbi:betaine reductase complex component B subunit gamma [Pseudoleptotrichia goodfellowii]|uniref:Betaine reductase complex component B subunit gamma n=3 Tax=Pseudoleptotrichia goodfellowii TaxID=157692 RepID=A0A510JCY7_9FUSO|nr:betaine reductase complex component B subunit gamma [Pseudoleptotrichia goodfellowii]